MDTRPPTAESKARAPEGLGFVLRLTLITLLLSQHSQWEVHVPLAALAILGLALPRLSTSPWLWMAITAAVAYRTITGWEIIDNHGYLTTWWCLAVTLAMFAGWRRDDGERSRLEQERAAILAFNGRVLIGACFTFAFVWKAFLSEDFVSGDFFRVALLQDHRLVGPSQLLGASLETLAHNQQQLSRLANQGTRALLQEPPGHLNAAQIATWWTLIIEGAIAIFFLAPFKASLRWLRDASLLVFGLTTYLFAPVSGFGCLLMAMGAAQCPAERTTLRRAYLATFIIILAYSWIPWAHWIHGL